MKDKILVHILTFLAIFLGLASGYTEFAPFLSAAEIITEIFLKLFRLIAPPIIFFSLASSISGMKSFEEIRTLGRRILFYTLSTTLCASTISLILFLLIDPANFALTSTMAPLAKTASGSYLFFLMQAIPDNLIKPFLENNILAVAFLGGVTGLTSLQLKKENKDSLHLLFSSFFSLILKATETLVYAMPVAIWGFSVIFVQEIKQGEAELGNLALYALCVLGSNIIQGFLVLPALLKWKKISPLPVAKAMAPALITAFFTKSSNAALPIAMQCAEEKLKISPRVSKVSFPMCSVINMNGCASFIFTTVLFVAVSNGITFSITEMIGWIFLSTLAAIGNAGVPMGCYFLSSAFLVGMGVPLNILGVILPLYGVFDMVETALNVWSDSTIAVIIDKELELEEKDLYPGVDLDLEKVSA
ncbi:MAG: Na+/H+-dicarboxylate symporter [Chlamydiales bacterium]|jgi:Na+/H+-dicarboxylate symporter